MAFNGIGLAEAIAAEWGVDVELLESSGWEVETIDGNDGEVYGYLIRFDDNTDPEILARLGLGTGEFTRQLSINAFDEPDRDPDDFKLREPPRQRANNRRAYYIGEQRFTPSQFKRLSASRKVEAMTQWFFSRYEDPAHSTSYNTREGGFLWNHGGPYDANDEIQNEFHDLASDDLMEDAVNEVQSDGIYEWAPIRGDEHDDYDRDLQLREQEDDGIYSINEPLPDFSDFDDEEDTEDEENADTLPPLPSGAPGGAPINELVVNDPAYNAVAYNGVITPYSSGTTSDDGVSIIPDEREDYTKTVLTRKDNPPHGGAYLIDENGSFLTDSAGNRLIVNLPSSAVSGSTVENLSFAPDSASTFGNFTFGQSTYGQFANQPATSEDFQQELLSRIENLEAELQSYQDDLPPRNHNHPPEPVEPDPITPSEVRIVVEVTIEMKAEAQQVQPDPVKLEVQASTLRRVAGSILAWLGRKADLTVDTAIKSGVPMIMRAAFVVAALTAVAEKASAWAHFLSLLH